jgi:hypothetical protein
VALALEDGTPIDRVEDPTNILRTVLPAAEDASFRYLNEIDWYGDTTFNSIQCAGVRKELERVAPAASVLQERALLERLIEFAARSHSSSHLHVRFLRRLNAFRIVTLCVPSLHAERFEQSKPAAAIGRTSV